MVSTLGPRESPLGLSSSDPHIIVKCTPQLTIHVPFLQGTACSWSYLLPWEKVPTWSYLWGPQAPELLLSWPLASVPCLGVVTRFGLG